jgi:PAS domain S-box-containing protein
MSENTDQNKIIRVLNAYEAEIVRLNRRVLDESPDLIAIIGSDFIYYYVNPSYIAIHGMREEDFIGFHVRKFLGDDIFEHIVKPNMELCMHGEDVHYEEWFDFGESGVLYMDVRYLPLHDGDGKVDRIVVVSRDITYRKEAEDYRMSQEKLRTIVELAGTYNHEINNPLCSLSGYIELLAMAETDPKRVEYFDKAKEEINRIAEVTRKIEHMTSVRLSDYPGGMQILNVDGECAGQA